MNQTNLNCWKNTKVKVFSQWNICDSDKVSVGQKI